MSDSKNRFDLFKKQLAGKSSSENKDRFSQMKTNNVKQENGIKPIVPETKKTTSNKKEYQPMGEGGNQQDIKSAPENKKKIVEEVIYKVKNEVVKEEEMIDISTDLNINADNSTSDVPVVSIQDLLDPDDNRMINASIHQDIGEHKEEDSLKNQSKLSFDQIYDNKVNAVKAFLPFLTNTGISATIPNELKLDDIVNIKISFPELRNYVEVFAKTILVSPPSLFGSEKTYEYYFQFIGENSNDAKQAFETYLLGYLQ